MTKPIISLSIAARMTLNMHSLNNEGGEGNQIQTRMIDIIYAIKMALLTAALRNYGLAEGEKLFPLLRDLELYLEPPAEMVVVKSFSKIRRELKDKNNAEKAQSAHEKKEYPMQPTIAYREYVNYQGTFHLACQVADEDPLSTILPSLLLQINYLGKRGGFMQIMDQPLLVSELPSGQFIHLTTAVSQDFETNGTLQMLDDCGPGLTFAKANIYHDAKIVMHKDRVLRHIVLPYQQVSSSRSYSRYQRITH